MRRAAIISGLLGLALAAVIVLRSSEGRHHPGFEDYVNPFAEAWSPDPRTEYGWPETFFRRFDEPSDVNAPGRVDPFGLGVDAVCWAVLAGVCLAPLLVAAHRNRRAAPRTGPTDRSAAAGDAEGRGE